MSLQARHFSAGTALGLVIGLTLIAALAIVFVTDEVFAQQQPGQLLPCSGRKFQQGVPCTKAAPCFGSNPCTTWVTPTLVDNCKAPNPVPGMNCRYDTNSLIRCGIGGDCWFDSDANECISLAFNFTIWTNPVGQKSGDCVIPETNPGDPPGN